MNTGQKIPSKPVPSWEEAMGEAAEAAKHAHEVSSVQTTEAWAVVANAWVAVADAITKRDQAANQAQIALSAMETARTAQDSLQAQRDGLDLLTREANRG